MCVCLNLMVSCIQRLWLGEFFLNIIVSEFKHKDEPGELDLLHETMCQESMFPLNINCIMKTY